MHSVTRICITVASKNTCPTSPSKSYARFPTLLWLASKTISGWIRSIRKSCHLCFASQIAAEDLRAVLKLPYACFYEPMGKWITRLRTCSRPDAEFASAKPSFFADGSEGEDENYCCLRRRTRRGTRRWVESNKKGLKRL